MVFNCHRTVSYTHLDVYKRQELSRLNAFLSISAITIKNDDGKNVYSVIKRNKDITVSVN